MDDQTAIALGFIAVDQVIRTRFSNNAIADLLRFLALVMGLISLGDNLLSYTDLEYYFNGVNATSLQTAISLILLSLCQWPDLQNVRPFAELNRVLRLREYALSIAVVLLGFVASEEKLLIEKANAAKAIQGDAERTSRTIIRNFHMVAGVAARVLGEQDSRHRAEMVIGYQNLFEKFGSIFLVVEANGITNGTLDRYIEDKFGFEFSFDQANLMELTDLDGNALWISGGIDRAGEPALVYISSETGKPNGDAIVVFSRPMELVFDANADVAQLLVRFEMEDRVLLSSFDTEYQDSERSLTKSFELGGKELSLYICPTPVFAAKYRPFSVNWLVPLISILAFIVGFSSNRSKLVSERNKELHAAQRENQIILDKLEQQNRELSQFAYICSHDLKEPFRMVSTFSKRLRTQIDGKADNDEMTMQYLDILSDAGDRAGHLIDDLLAYTTCDDDEIPRERFDPLPIIEECFNSAKLIKPKRECNFSHGKFTILNANRLQFKQIAQNLIDNAVKYSKPDGPIAVQLFTRLSGREIVFVVKDNGIGVPPQHREKIFGVFKRLQARDAVAGTGIGLAICAKIVTAYNGKIWVDSECTDGTEICFTLPAATQNN